MTILSFKKNLIFDLFDPPADKRCAVRTKIIHGRIRPRHLISAGKRVDDRGSAGFTLIKRPLARHEPQPVSHTLENGRPRSSAAIQASCYVHQSRALFPCFGREQTETSISSALSGSAGTTRCFSIESPMAQRSLKNLCTQTTAAAGRNLLRKRIKPIAARLWRFWPYMRTDEK